MLDIRKNVSIYSQVKRKDVLALPLLHWMACLHGPAAHLFQRKCAQLHAISMLPPVLEKKQTIPVPANVLAQATVISVFSSFFLDQQEQKVGRRWKRIQQQWMKEGPNNPWSSGRRKMQEGLWFCFFFLKKKEGRESSIRKSTLQEKAQKNFIIPDQMKSNGYSLNKGE